MGRKRVSMPMEIETPAEVPAWWPAHFHARQRALGDRIARNLERAGGVLSCLSLAGTIGGYSRMEREHALGVMKAAGRIREFTRREPGRGGMQIVAVRYYRLPGASPAAAVRA